MEDQKVQEVVKQKGPLAAADFVVCTSKSNKTPTRARTSPLSLVRYRRAMSLAYSLEARQYLPARIPNLFIEHVIILLFSGLVGGGVQRIPRLCR